MALFDDLQGESRKRFVLERRTDKDVCIDDNPHSGNSGSTFLLRLFDEAVDVVVSQLRRDDARTRCPTTGEGFRFPAQW